MARTQRDVDAEQEKMQRNTLPGLTKRLGSWISEVTAQPAAFDPAPELYVGAAGAPNWSKFATPALGPRSTPAQRGAFLGDILGQIAAQFPAGSPGNKVTAATVNNAVPGMATQANVGIAAPEQLSGLERGGRTPGYFNVQAAPGSPTLRFPGHLAAVGGMAAGGMLDDYDQSQRRSSAGTLAAGEAAAGRVSLSPAGAVTRTPEQQTTWEAEQERGPSAAQKTSWGQDLQPEPERLQRWNEERQSLVNGPGTETELREGLAALTVRQNQEWSQHVQQVRQDRQLATAALEQIGKSVPKELKGLLLDLSRGNSTEQIGQHLAKTGQLAGLDAGEAARKIADVSNRHATFIKTQQANAGIGGAKSLTDAYNYFVASGEEPGNAVKYAGQWAKAMQAESAGKIGEAMTPAQRDIRAQDPAGEGTRRQRIAEVAAAARAAVAARQDKPGTAPAAGTAPTAKRSMREIEREDKELGVAAKKQQARMTEVEGIAKLLKLRMDAVGPAMMELDAKQQAAYDALPEAAKRKFLSDLVASYLKRQGA